MATSAIKPIIKIKKYTGTTTSTGAFSIDPGLRVIWAVSSTSGTIVLVRSDAYVRVVSSADLSGIANTSMTITLAYIDL